MKTTVRILLCRIFGIHHWTQWEAGSHHTDTKYRYCLVCGTTETKTVKE